VPKVKISHPDFSFSGLSVSVVFVLKILRYSISLGQNYACECALNRLVSHMSSDRKAMKRSLTKKEKRKN
jgi:hypothetical protein